VSSKKWNEPNPGKKGSTVYEGNESACGGEGIVGPPSKPGRKNNLARISRRLVTKVLWFFIFHNDRRREETNTAS